MRFSSSSAALSLALVGVVGISCAQREVPCSVGRSLPYAAKYKQISLDGACDGVPAAALAGDQLGFTAYNGIGPGGLPDTTKVSVAIRTSFLGTPVAEAEARGVVDEADGHAVAAVGPFDSDVPKDGFCTAPTLSPTTQSLPALEEDVDEELDAQDPINVSETWRDVSVYVDASALGTQMKGTYVVTQDGCTATYHVMAMYPAGECAEDADCANIDLGISPDFAVVCDPDLSLCVLDADVDDPLPVFR